MTQRGLVDKADAQADRGCKSTSRPCLLPDTVKNSAAVSQQPPPEKSESDPAEVQSKLCSTIVLVIVCPRTLNKTSAHSNRWASRVADFMAGKLCACLLLLLPLLLLLLLLLLLHHEVLIISRCAVIMWFSVIVAVAEGP
jgi:hypothetical protein